MNSILVDISIGLRWKLKTLHWKCCKFPFDTPMFRCISAACISNHRSNHSSSCCRRFYVATQYIPEMNSKRHRLSSNRNQSNCQPHNCQIILLTRGKHCFFVFSRLTQQNVIKCICKIEDSEKCLSGGGQCTTWPSNPWQTVRHRKNHRRTTGK